MWRLYPYPFKAKPEEVTDYVRGPHQSAAESINHSIDEKVESPALHVTSEIDPRYASIVDFGKVAVNHISDPDNPGEYLPDTTYQYQPVLALNRAVYSNGRLQQLRLHAALLRRATETADTISSHWQATSSLVSAQAHVYQLSDSMLHELQMLQASTASLSVSFQNTATTTVQPYIPPHVQEAFADLSQNLSDTAAEFSLTLATKDLPLEEKATKIASDVRERIMPLLGRLTKALGDILQKPGSSTPAATADGGAGSVNENKSDRDSGGAQAAAGNAQSSK